MPVSTSNTPITRSTVTRCRLKYPENPRKVPTPAAASRNGMPRPKRIDRKQPGAPRHILLAGGNRQDGGEDGADAGRPAKGKGQANAIGAKKAHRLRMMMVARFPVQEADLEQPDEMQAHQHDGKAGDGGCHIHLITEDRDREADELPERLAKHRGAGPQRDENRRKSQHETQRRKKGAALLGNGCAIAVGQLIERGAGDEAQIGRHQRQHAGAQKTDGARQQCGLQGNM